MKDSWQIITERRNTFRTLFDNNELNINILGPPYKDLSKYFLSRCLNFGQMSEK